MKFRIDVRRSTTVLGAGLVAVALAMGLGGCTSDVPETLPSPQRSDDLPASESMVDPEQEAAIQNHVRSALQQYEDHLEQVGGMVMDSYEIVGWHGYPLDRETKRHRVFMEVCVDTFGSEPGASGGEAVADEEAPKRKLLKVEMRGTSAGGWAVAEEEDDGETC